MLETETDSTAHLYVRNIGGIDETTVTFEPGVCILAGRNATNRTSLLKALMAVLGSDNTSIKTDADEAQVELTIDDTTYTRTFERQNGEVRSGGEPYLADPTLAELFAFLVESNEARRTAVTGENLRELIMRPVDTEEINAEIERQLDQRREISQQLDELEGLKRKLPSLEQERTRIQNEISDVREELDAVETQIAEEDAAIEERQKEQTELEARFTELKEKRSDLDDVRYELETERDRLESLQNEQAELQAEYEGLSEVHTDEIDRLDAQIRDLRSRKQRLEDELTDIQSLVRFNQEMLDGDADELFDRLDDEQDASEVTEELLADSTMTCWTCGSEVETEQIGETVERLQTLSLDTRTQINDIESELADLSEKKQELQDTQHRREQLERRIETAENESEDVQARIEELRQRRDTLHEAVEAVEAAVEDLETDTHDDILELHRDANQLEYELGGLETDLERVEDNISNVETQLEQEDDLKRRREDVQESIQQLRTRIERIEKETVEEFNEHMDTVLALLEYENIERIWLERLETEVREGRRKVDRTTFEFHIVRKTRTGTTYEDTLENLSESEREVMGLNFALAGYLVHDVYETVPFMLLDSLEAIDSDRIAALIEYFSEYSQYLVSALLTEDAAALDDEHQYIREI